MAVEAWQWKPGREGEEVALWGDSPCCAVRGKGTNRRHGNNGCGRGLVRREAEAWEGPWGVAGWERQPLLGGDMADCGGGGRQPLFPLKP